MINASLPNEGTTEIAEIRLSGSGSTNLSSGEYYFEYKHVNARSGIKWSFESSHYQVGIIVLAMDQKGYDRYKVYGTSNDYVLSDGSYWRDSGTFVVPYEGIWYIMFINGDKWGLQTSLSYDVKYNYVDPIPIIISVISIVGIAGAIVAVVLLAKKDKKSKNKLSQSIILP